MSDKNWNRTHHMKFYILKDLFEREEFRNNTSHYFFDMKNIFCKQLEELEFFVSVSIHDIKEFLKRKNEIKWCLIALHFNAKQEGCTIETSKNKEKH